MMRTIELACAAIVLLYLLVRVRTAGSERRSALVGLACLALAAWVGEDSVIRAYGFYAYAPGWSVFLDRVPLLIVAIWPVVIDSAHLLARQLVASPRVPLVGALLVLADASLIEPIAVRARLWSWGPENARALFDVPLIGVLGWAYFAAGAIAVLQRRRPALAIVAAPLAAHAALVLSWWALFRWLGADGGATSWAASLAWLVSVPVTLAAWRVGGRVPLGAVLVRAPGAVFFFALLGAIARGAEPLVLFALAFAPPYLALLLRRVTASSSASRVASM